MPNPLDFEELDNVSGDELILVIDPSDDSGGSEGTQKRTTLGVLTVPGSQFTQDLSSTEFADIVHNLGRYPQVSILDSSGNLVVADVQHISTDELTISFSSEFTGTAVLS